MDWHICTTLENKFKWLDNSILNFTQQILRLWRGINGLQNTMLKFHKAEKNSVQIHYVPGHWVVSYKDDKGAIHIYDSSFQGSLSEELFQQIITLYSTEPYIEFSIASVQQQDGGNDCGVFAVAFITDVVYGNDPRDVTYHQPELRTHLLKCLKRRFLTTFPRGNQNTQRRRCKEVKFRFYSYTGQRFVECSKCKDWITWGNVSPGADVLCPNCWSYYNGHH